jgi:quercetin dioxygenase-like cupin family protein
MAEASDPRRVIPLTGADYRVYDMEGPVQPDMSYAALSWEKTRAEGVYVMRMKPGAVTIRHEHRGFEDFLILEGELIESDGTVFRAGDFVSYRPGTVHNSRTETGCVLVGFDWRPR